LTYIKGYEFERLNEILWQDNTAINIIEYKEGKYHLVVEGDWSHLGKELSTIAYQDWWQQFLKERGIEKQDITIIERRESYE